MGINAARPRFLTKSRFKLAVECPRKLFYTGKKEYLDKSRDDSFLAALAEGGSRFKVASAVLWRPPIVRRLSARAWLSWVRFFDLDLLCKFE